MYAVIKTGGKQYRVAPNDVIVVEKLAGEPGAVVELDQVLLIGDEQDLTVGAPLVEGARVAATVLDQTRDKKIIVFKKKRRKNYRRTRGHRQDVTVLRITDILAKGKKTRRSRAETPAAKDEPTESAAPDTATPDTAAPDTATPDTATPDTATPETAAPETAAPETAATETGAESAPAAKKKPAASTRRASSDEPAGTDKPESTAAPKRKSASRSKKADQGEAGKTEENS